MTRPIAPQFEALAEQNPEAAGALSETILNPDAFLLFGTEADRVFRKARELVAVQAAFMSGDTILNELVLLEPTADAAGHFIEGHRQLVTPSHFIANEVAKATPEGKDAVGIAVQRVKAQTEAAGLVTVAAHLMYRTRWMRRHLNALLVPGKVFTDVQLELREDVMKARTDDPGWLKDDAFLDAQVRDLFHNTATARRNVGFIAATSLLWPVETVKTELRQFMA